MTAATGMVPVTEEIRTRTMRVHASVDVDDTEAPPRAATVAAETAGNIHARARLLDLTYDYGPSRAWGWRLTKAVVYGGWWDGDRNTGLAYQGEFTRHNAPAWLAAVAERLAAERLAEEGSR